MAAEIHPTAIIEDGAVIGADCYVGPYCIIGANVQMGDRCNLHSHVVVDGYTSLGADVEIFPFACIGKRTQDLKYQGGTMPVEIGANCVLREYVTVNQPTQEGGKTVLGPDCNLLAYCHVAHDCRLGRGVIISNATNLAGHVSIGDHTVFGGMCGVHQFCRIGSLTMISALSKVVQDVPPCCLVDGNPARLVTINKVGLQRHGRDPTQVQTVMKLFKRIFRSPQPLEQAAEKAKEEIEQTEDVKNVLAFIEASERGIARSSKNEQE